MFFAEKPTLQNLRLWSAKHKSLREQERPIVYMDETNFHGTTTKQRAWTDGQEAELTTPISSGCRVIVVHAGGEDGFIPNVMLMF
jgi:hypothetical protein